jgi:hypothetical protein
MCLMAQLVSTQNQTVHYSKRVALLLSHVVFRLFKVTSSHAVTLRLRGSVFLAKYSSPLV